ncbi:MAG: alpha/beta fold hydrolase [Alphaproteobacteria bacterium]
MPMDKRKFVTVAGIETCYYEAGEGPPLVLFHGGSLGARNAAFCALDWSLNFDGLAERYHVFAIDKLGQGYTGIPTDDDDYTMAATVRHACATLDALGVANAHLVGHSRGGYLTCRITLERPDLAASCTIVDSNTCSPGAAKSAIVLADPPEPRLSKASQRWIIEHYSYATGHISEAWLDALVAIAKMPPYLEAERKLNVEGLLGRQYIPQLAHDKMEMFGWIRDRGMGRPTQILWGYNDPTATIEQARILFDLIAARERDARMNVINQAGHFSYREHPKAFNALLHGFVDGAS